VRILGACRTYIIRFVRVLILGVMRKRGRKRNSTFDNVWSFLKSNFKETKILMQYIATDNAAAVTVCKNV